MEADGLTGLDVAESILNSVAVSKVIRSTSARRKKLASASYYFLISSKKAI